MMLNEETRKKLRELNLPEILEAIDRQATDKQFLSMPFEERLQFMVDYLYQEKNNSKIQRLVKQARFRLPRADVNDIVYEGRGLDQHLITELRTCQFLNIHTNIVCQGFTGSGKTFMACAFGKQACLFGSKVRYIRVPDLLIEMDEASLKIDGFSKLLRKYSRIPLLILDEWLLDECAKDEQHFLFELMERRYDCTSTLFCTQYTKKDWHQRLGGGVHADAIMDRIVHNAVWIDTGPLNLRELQLNKKWN